MKSKDRPKIPILKMDLETFNSANPEIPSSTFVKNSTFVNIPQANFVFSEIPLLNSINSDIQNMQDTSLSSKNEENVEQKFILKEKEIPPISLEDLRPESILLEFAERAVYGTNRRSNEPLTSLSPTKKNQLFEIIKLEDVFAEQDPLRVTSTINNINDIKLCEEGINKNKNFELIDVPWVSPKKVVFQNVNIAVGFNVFFLKFFVFKHNFF